MSKALAITLAIALLSALAVPAHAAEKADDDAFILGCIWTGDSKGTVCGGFPTRALCEREGRAAVASGELLSFNCDSVAGPSAPAQPTWPPGQGNSLGGQEAGGIGNVLSMLDHVMGGLFGGGSPTKYGDPRAVQPTFAQRPQPPVARPGGFFDYLGGGGQIAGLDALQHPPGASCVDLRDDSHKVTCTAPSNNQQRLRKAKAARHRGVSTCRSCWISRAALPTTRRVSQSTQFR
jgi:hypothetical protein